MLNNQGRIWVGSANSNYGRPWQFAQFTKQALQVALYLLDKLPKKDRADPIKVCSLISPVSPVGGVSSLLSGVQAYLCHGQHTG